MEVEELEPVDYLSYMNDMRRITHEVEGLKHIPEAENLQLKDLEELNRQQRLCKRIQAALHVKIREIQDKKRKVENR